MDKIIEILIKSSADPKKTSLTVKAALLAIVPFIMQAVGLVCAFGLTCTNFDASLLENFFTLIAELVYHTLMIGSVAGVLWGAMRKLWKTVRRTNPVLFE